MELPISTGLWDRLPRRSSLCPLLNRYDYYLPAVILPRRRLRTPKSKPFLRAELSLNSKASSSPNSNLQAWGGTFSEFVDVIGIGSRKDVVLDFCLRSPLLSSDFDISCSIPLPGNDARKESAAKEYCERIDEREVTTKVTEGSPVVEINYRGGIYICHCQGGLPEGKGRQCLDDGSINDGMWRSGKRSGFCSYNFSNGDMFRGTWRDDIMHGKGWLYFFTGDRWFVNFWKGKANGEGRFYSKSGDILFVNFRNGWRDGHFLCINVVGSRFLEIWDEGVLVRHEQLDNDADAG